MSIDNLRAVYALSTEAERAQGKHWYAVARASVRGMATRYGLTPELVAAVVAAISPRNKWEYNLADAEKMIKAFQAGLSFESFTVHTFNRNKSIAWRMLRESDARLLNGPKVTAFKDNILCENSTMVTVDSHAVNAYLGERIVNGNDSKVGVKAFRLAEQAYRDLADELGMRPYELQAIIWVAWRRLIGL